MQLKFVKAHPEPWIRYMENYWRIDTALILPKYRGKTDLSKKLMETVISYWEEKLDGEYLYCDAESWLENKIKASGVFEEVQLPLKERTFYHITITLFRYKR